VTWCVYAVTGAAAGPLRVRGLRGEALTLIRAAPLAAVVGAMQRAPKPTAANLSAYHETLQQLSSGRRSLLPVRFGTLLSAEEIAFVLRARGASLSRALVLVRRRVQMTVRLIEAAGEAQSDTAAPLEGTGPMSADAGTAFLKSRASAAERARAVPVFDPLRPAVRRWVKAERVERRNGVVSIYHLVPRGSAGAYRRTLRAAAAAAGIAAQISGPFPAYAFTSTSEFTELTEFSEVTEEKRRVRRNGFNKHGETERRR
jgi:gas vesicle protein GvpL/GvpF